MGTNAALFLRHSTLNQQPSTSTKWSPEKELHPQHLFVGET